MASENPIVEWAADRVLVVINPGAGARASHDAVGDLMTCLKARGLAGEVVSSLPAFDALVARYQAAGQLRAVVAAGGDGTVAEIVNRTEPGVPLTVYPLGTANLLASYLHIERDPLALAQVLVAGTTVRLDAARANGRIFFLMAGCGFDAEVVERLHRKRDGGHISYWTYAWPILETIRSYRYPRLRVYCQTAAAVEVAAEPLSARWAFVVNLPCYAGGLQLAPEAVGSDGLLNVCTFHNGSFWHALRYLGYVAARRHRTLPDYKSALVTRVRIESDEPVPYQLDGEPGGCLPLVIEVLAERLTLLAPAARILALGLQPVARPRAGAR